MAKTNYFEYLFPDEGERPYYTKISNFFNSLDRSIYSRLEDWNYIYFGGGTITFNSATGVLSWSAPIYLLNIMTGYKYIIQSGSITINNGETIYVNITRNLNVDTQVTINKMNSLLPNKSDYDSIYVLGVRIGNNLILRPMWNVL